LETSIYLINKR